MVLTYGLMKKRIDNVIQLIESNDSVITDLKIVVCDSCNKGSLYIIAESE